MAQSMCIALASQKITLYPGNMFAFALRIVSGGNIPLVNCEKICASELAKPSLQTSVCGAPQFFISNDFNIINIRRLLVFS